MRQIKNRPHKWKRGPERRKKEMEEETKKEKQLRVIEVISNIPAYFSRFSARKKDGPRIRFTPAYRGPARWIGYYKHQDFAISVKLCHDRNCLYCQNGLKDYEIRFGVDYLVDLDYLDSGELVVINGQPTTRKYFAAHNLREAAKQIKAEKAEKDEFCFPKLPSLNIDLPEIPTTGFRIVALGSVGRVGASCYAYINGKGEILVVDCGIDVGAFGGYDGNDFDEFLNEEKRLPNFEWLEKNSHRIKGILITHGHLDHWGAVPYLSRNITNNVPIYATNLVAELIKRQCRFLRQSGEPEIKIFEPGDAFQFGETSVETFLVNHSIPQACGLVIAADGKKVCHLSDFRLSGVSVSDRLVIIDNLRKAARDQVDLLAMDVVNVREPRFSLEEERVFSELKNIVSEALLQNRVIISFFGTNIARMKAVIAIAKETGRKLKFVGRTICDIYEIVRKLEMVEEAPKDGEGEIYCATGCQAEPGSCLEQLSQGKEVEGLSLKSSDVVIISSRPIPGSRNRLEAFKDMVVGLVQFAGIVFVDERGYFPEAFKGLNVEAKDSLHISGHGHQMDLMLVIYLLNPERILPIHSDYWAMEKFRDEVMKEYFPSIVCRDISADLPIIKVD
ncbi:MAG: ribonuclease J [Patescibacteria group bacterium]